MGSTYQKSKKKNVQFVALRQKRNICLFSFVLTFFGLQRKGGEGPRRIPHIHTPTQKWIRLPPRLKDSPPCFSSLRWLPATSVSFVCLIGSLISAHDSLLLKSSAERIKSHGLPSKHTPPKKKPHLILPCLLRCHQINPTFLSFLVLWLAHMGWCLQWGQSLL